MNWTGGRLQRHSRANANLTLKAQKRYFAKSRQHFQNDESRPSPSSFSLLHVQNDTKANIGIKQETGSSQRPKPNANLHDLAEEDTSHHYLPRIAPHAPPDLQSNPLEHLKQKLLQKSDWAGLSATRPAHIEFQPVEEMERIGRRRKVSKGERRRKLQDTRAGPPHHNIIRPFQHQDYHSIQPRQLEENYSIRIGSNIHQTQTTRQSIQQRVHSTASRSTHPDSMLLDKFEAAQTPALDSMSVGEAPELRSTPQQTGRVLMPLKDARVFKTFDEVLRRSSSPVVQNAGVQDLPTNREQNDRHERINWREDYKQEDREGMLGATQMNSISAPSVAAQPEVDQDMRAHGIATPLQKSDRPEFASVTTRKTETPNQIRKNNQTNGMSSGPADQGQSPFPARFTIDQQVLLEQHVNSISSAPRAGDDMLPEIDENNSLQGKSSFEQTPDAAAGGEVFAAISNNLMTKGMQLEYSQDVRADLVPSNQPATGVSNVRKSHYATATSNEYMPDAQASQSRWRDRFLLAKEKHEDSIFMGTDDYEPWKPPSAGMGEQNEAWMKYVFPKDFDRIQNSFAFSQPPPKTATHSSISPRHSPNKHTSRPVAPIQSAHLDIQKTHSTTESSIPSAANATLFEPLAANEDMNSKSETDFLSRLSPMEGVLDDRYGNISLYNNPARTNNSYMPSAQTEFMRLNVFSTPERTYNSRKRSAHLAFEQESYSSTSAHTSSSTRQPLHLLKQPRLWNPHEDQVGPKAQHKESSECFMLQRNSARGISSNRTQLGPPKKRDAKSVFPMNYSPAMSPRKKVQDFHQTRLRGSDGVRSNRSTNGSDSSVPNHYTAVRTPITQRTT